MNKVKKRYFIALALFSIFLVLTPHSKVIVRSATPEIVIASFGIFTQDTIINKDK